MNIESIARLAGVSKATVSRVLNKKPFVKEKTKEKVKEVMHYMDYTPNLLARNLSLKKSQYIGVILPDIGSGFFSDVLERMDREATSQGYYLIATFSHSSKKLGWGKEFLNSGMVEGLIIMAPQMPEEEIEKLARSDKKIVILNRNFSCSKIPTINVDEVQASYNVVSHLLSHKYEKIGIVTGPKNNFDSQARLTGYMKALLSKGKKFESSFMEEGSFTEAGGYEATKKLYSEGRLPRAIFYANDAMALGGVRFFGEKGIRVPEDIAIAGFDDIKISEFMGFTTVRMPLKEIAEASIGKVLGRVKDNKIILEGEIVIRESCGCKMKKEGFYEKDGFSNRGFGNSLEFSERGREE